MLSANTFVKATVPTGYSYRMNRTGTIRAIDAYYRLRINAGSVRAVIGARRVMALFFVVLASPHVTTPNGMGSIPSQLQGSATVAQARHELERRGIEYSGKAFVENAGNGNTTVIALFIDAGMNINVKGDSGQTALIAAASSGECPAVELLLNRGASVNAKDDDGATALHGASGSVDDFKCVKALIDHGGDVNARTSTGRTPLVEVVLLPQMPEVAEFIVSDAVAKISLLLDKGADINARYRGESTPLMRAAIGGNVRILKLLLKRGADPKAVNAQGQTAQKLAIQYHNREAAKLIEQAGG
ncbi:MAG: ankyrin repeat domain-containing protein [Blastocatellia bacterium]